MNKRIAILVLAVGHCRGLANGMTAGTLSPLQDDKMQGDEAPNSVSGYDSPPGLPGQATSDS